MRIAIFSENFHPELSGITDSITLLGAELAKRGHSIRYYVPRYSAANYRHLGMPVAEPKLGKGRSVERFFSLPLPNSPSGQGRLVIPTGLRTRSIGRWRPDVLHTQLFGGVGLEALMAARSLKKPLIGTNHTAIREFVKQWKFPLLEDAMCRVWNWYYEKCDLVTAPSQSVFDEMNQLGFDQERQVVVSNPLHTDIFRPLPDRAGLRKKFGFPHRTALYAGRLAPEKSIETILGAWPAVLREHSDAMLVFAGTGPSEKKLRQLAEELGISHRVKFLGFIPPARLAEAMNASAVFLMMSTSETQSLGTIQALACGIPAIGANARALPEYIKPDRGIIVEPEDAPGLADAILTLFRKPALAARLGAAATKAAQDFSAPRVAARWEEIYGEAIREYTQANENKLRHPRA